MKITSIAELMNNPIDLLDSVANNGEPLFIHRPEDKSVVILSTEEYNRLKAVEYQQKTNESPE